MGHGSGGRTKRVEVNALHLGIWGSIGARGSGLTSRRRLANAPHYRLLLPGVLPTIARMAEPAELEVCNLSKRYGRVEAVRGISFRIAPGEIFGLLGPNGAGKTTTLECLVGLRAPDAGELRVGGDRQQIGVALQDTALPDAITVREALTLFASFYPRPAGVPALLERFGLGARAATRFDALSGGERQRL